MVQGFLQTFFSFETKRERELFFLDNTLYGLGNMNMNLLVFDTVLAMVLRLKIWISSQKCDREAGFGPQDS